MKRTLLFLIAASFLALQPFAQSNGNEGEPHAWGRGFFAPGLVTNGDSSAFLAMGGGGEGRISDTPITVSMELAWLYPTDSVSDGIGAFSPGVGYSFGHGRTHPFATGGYTLFFRDGHANGFFFGGGVNHWINDRFGLGFEVRDAVLQVSDPSSHFLQFRANFLFH